MIWEDTDLVTIEMDIINPLLDPQNLKGQLDLALFWAEHFSLSLWGNLPEEEEGSSRGPHTLG